MKPNSVKTVNTQTLSVQLQVIAVKSKPMLANKFISIQFIRWAILWKLYNTQTRIPGETQFKCFSIFYYYTGSPVSDYCGFSGILIGQTKFYLPYFTTYHPWKRFQPITGQITVVIFHEIATVLFSYFLESHQREIIIKFQKIKEGKSGATHAFFTNSR